MGKVNFKQVNWENGMLPSADDFIATENFFIHNACIMQQARLSGLNYGLLPQKRRDDQLKREDIEVQHTVTDKIEIRLLRCYGITLGGYVVDYQSDGIDCISYTITTDVINKESTDRINRWSIILTVDPYKRVLDGMPDNNTLPPRYPNVVPEYTLSLLPIDQATKGLTPFSLIVGRIRKEGERFVQDHAYIPPCSCLASHPELMQYYRDFGKLFTGLEKTSKDIVNKVINRSDSSPIAINISNICKNIMQYIAYKYFEYCNNGKSWEPVKLIECFSGLAHVCFNSLNFIERTDKDDVMQYFYEWSDINPGVFESMLTEAINLEYEHEELQSMLFIVERFLKSWTELWSVLSSLDYIGRHKDNIVVGERTRYTGGPERSEWTPFDITT